MNDVHLPRLLVHRQLYQFLQPIQHSELSTRQLADEERHSEPSQLRFGRFHIEIKNGWWWFNQQTCKFIYVKWWLEHQQWWFNQQKWWYDLEKLRKLEGDIVRKAASLGVHPHVKTCKNHGFVLLFAEANLQDKISQCFAPRSYQQHGLHADVGYESDMLGSKWICLKMLELLTRSTGKSSFYPLNVA